MNFNDWETLIESPKFLESLRLRKLRNFLKIEIQGARDLREKRKKANLLTAKVSDGKGLDSGTGPKSNDTHAFSAFRQGSFFIFGLIDLVNLFYVS